MNIYQIVPNLSYGDGVGNDILAIDSLLKRKGFHTCVYAKIIDERISASIAKPFEQFPKVNGEDIVILHLAVGSEINEWFKKCACRRIIRYHNITPAHFFEKYSIDSVRTCREGLKEIKALNTAPDYCLAVSEYNKADLRSLNYRMKIDVVPILIPFRDYEQTPSQKILEKYRDSFTNILFTGRIVPNKKQEDVILAFYYYQKYYNPNSRLFLVGSYKGMELYYERLKKYVETLGVNNVIFTGHIRFDEILAYYHLADVFLCMSEHEGFCIPIVEAMYMQVPVVAYDAAAVGETMGRGGILLKEKDCLLAAGCLNYVASNEDFRKELLNKQNKELKRFRTDYIEKNLLERLNEFIAEGGQGL